MAIDLIAPKIGYVPQTLHTWIKRREIDSSVREGITTSEQQRLKELERENKELRKANEILKLARAFFAQAELDRRLKSRALDAAPGTTRRAPWQGGARHHHP